MDGTSGRRWNAGCSSQPTDATCSAVITSLRTRKDEATSNLPVPGAKGEEIMPNFQWKSSGVNNICEPPDKTEVFGLSLLHQNKLGCWLVGGIFPFQEMFSTPPHRPQPPFFFCQPQLLLISQFSLQSDMSKCHICWEERKGMYPHLQGRMSTVWKLSE